MILDILDLNDLIHNLILYDLMSWMVQTCSNEMNRAGWLTHERRFVLQSVVFVWSFIKLRSRFGPVCSHWAGAFDRTVHRHGLKCFFDCTLSTLFCHLWLPFRPFRFGFCFFTFDLFRLELRSRTRGRWKPWRPKPPWTSRQTQRHCLCHSDLCHKACVLPASDCRKARLSQAQRAKPHPKAHEIVRCCWAESDWASLKACQPHPLLLAPFCRSLICFQRGKDHQAEGEKWWTKITKYHSESL